MSELDDRIRLGAVLALALIAATFVASAGAKPPPRFWIRPGVSLAAAEQRVAARLKRSTQSKTAVCSAELANPILSIRAGGARDLWCYGTLKSGRRFGIRITPVDRRRVRVTNLPHGSAFTTSWSSSEPFLIR